MEYLTDKERWEDPKHRKLIEDAVLSQIDRGEIPLLLWCTEGSPWEEWTKLQIAQRNRVKAFLENIPRFV